MSEQVMNFRASGHSKRQFTLRVCKNQKEIRVNAAKTHSSECLSHITELWKEGICCDVTLQAEGCNHACHKVILAAFSGYFRAMFTSGMEESQASTVPIHGVTSVALKAILEYLYIGAFKVDSDVLQDVVAAADLLQLWDLKDACCHLMLSYIDQVNCLGMIDFGLQFGNKEISEAALRLVKVRTRSVIKDEDFLQISHQCLLMLVQCQDLNLGEHGEDHLLQSILQWFEFKPKERQPYLNEILSHIKYSQVSDGCLEMVKKDLCDKDFSDVCESLAKCQSLLSSSSVRKPLKAIYVIGGYLQSRTGPVCPRTGSVERYIPEENIWESVMEIPFIPTCSYAFEIQGHLIVIATDSSADVKKKLTVYDFDVVSGGWKDINSNVSACAAECLHQEFMKSHTLAALKTSTWNLTYCAKSGVIYVGSPNAVTLLNVTVDVSGNVSIVKGVSYPAVPTPADLQEEVTREDYALVTNQGKLYSLGGTLRKSQTEFEGTSDVYYFQIPSINGGIWVQKASMLEMRSTLAAVSIGNFIYAMGGFSQIRLSSVEQYDVKQNTWTRIERMMKHRTHATAVVLNNQIYICGGKSYADNFLCGGARKVIKTCERYDPETKQWVTLQDMLKSKCMFSAAVL